MTSMDDSRGWPRRAAGLGLAALSAALYASAYPPVDLRVAAVCALVPFFVALEHATRREALALGLVWSLMSMSAGITDWLVGAVAIYYEQPLLVGAAILLGTTLVGASIEYCAVAVWYQAVRHALSPKVWVVAVAAAWTSAEICRTRLGFGNPWGLFGYSIVDSGHDSSPWRYFTQVADLGGVYAITFVLVATNVALARGIGFAFRRQWQQALTSLAMGALLIASAAGYGAIRLQMLGDDDGARVAIAIAQPDLDLGSQWHEEMYGRNLLEYLDMTVFAAQTQSPRVMFWPENAMTFFVDQEPSYRAAIGRILSEYDLELIAGAPRFENEANPDYFNSAFVFRPDGQISGSYDKERLLPFGEYFPLGAIELLRRNFGRVREIHEGTNQRPVTTRIGEAGIIICNEAMYPEDAAARARDGAQILINLSNDSWVPGLEFAENQLRIATLRAIEQRRYLVRASTSGPSAIVSPSGRVLTRSKPFTTAVLSGQVAPRTELSLYARAGDMFAWVCLGFAIATFAFAIFTDESGR